MSNPVFNRLENQWSAEQQQAQSPIYDQQAFNQARAAYEAPAATAVQTGRMTYDDVIVKTGLNLAILIAVATVSWFISASNPALGSGLMIGGLLIGFVLAMVNIFSKTVRPGLILTYSAMQGVALGALSQVMNSIVPGVVVQAVVATFIVFGVTLALFASGKVRNSPKLQKFALISILGIILSRLGIWILGMFGLNLGGGVNDPLVMGIPLGVLISVFAVFIAAIALIGDFDQVQKGVQHGVPAIYAWSAAFGIMVTVVWLYVEILNILSRMASR